MLRDFLPLVLALACAVLALLVSDALRTAGNRALEPMQRVERGIR